MHFVRILLNHELLMILRFISIPHSHRSDFGVWSCRDRDDDHSVRVRVWFAPKLRIFVNLRSFYNSGFPKFNV